MNLKNIIKSGVCALALAATLPSCTEWLNVKPSNQIAAEELFSKEEGFKSALTGVYTLMAAPELYGRDMTFGAMDYLGQYWISPNNYSPYFAVFTYDFEKADAMNIIDRMWENQYNAIANINDMLAFIDENRKVFTDEKSHSIIKGEALGLRAYLHFDMLRAFAPYSFGTEEAESKPWLPYIKEYSKSTKESVSNARFAEEVLADLTAAADLLKADPILTGEAPDDGYFKNRIYHMNYYAVKALTARVCMYIGEQEKAKAAAEEVIAAQLDRTLFPWVKLEDITNIKAAERDRVFASEHIFALNVRRLGDHLQPFQGIDNATSPLKLAKGKAIFGKETEYREKFVDNNNFSTKLNQPQEASSAATVRFLRRMPMLRISEMYYILAECTQDISFLNAVRAQRGIVNELEADADFETELQKEYEKEFIGEGQFFFFNKRKGNRSINQKVGGYTLVMPQTEIDFGGRPRPIN